MKSGKKSIFIILGDDFKVQEWRESFEVDGDELISLRNGLWMVIDVIKHLLSYGSADAIVLRYLNDRRSFFGSCRLALGEWLSIAIAYVVGIRVVWICHNVDKETKMNYPKLTKIRRWVVAKMAVRIFVTDPLLQKYVPKFMPTASSCKVDWLTFGAYSPKSIKSHSVTYDIQSFANNFRERTEADRKSPLLGLCFCSPGNKYLHFDYARALIHAAKQTKYRIALILGGNLSKDNTERQQQELNLIVNEPDILLIPRYVRVNEFELTDSFDFYWRGYRDFSMSYTLYVAASVSKPVLALDSGFVGIAVRKYRLGSVIKSNFSDLEKGLTQLESWEPDNGSKFLTTHSWRIGATRLRGAIG